jgi:SPOR domain
MSEPAAKRHPIDLDEFDRRLRAPAPPPREQAAPDPLAELAKLVNSSPDPFAPIFAASRTNSRREQPPAQAAPAPVAPAGYDPNDAWRRREAELANPPAYAADPAPPPVWDSARYQPPLTKRRWSRASLAIGSAIAVVLVAAAAVLLHGHGGRFGGTPTILADARPYKIIPPSQPPRDQIESATTLLDKGATAMRPAHIVSTEEQPVDLAVATQGQGGEGSAPSGDAGDFAGFPAPRQVKTVSVRPDGTVISENDPNAAESASNNGGATASSPLSAADSSEDAPAADAPPSASSAASTPPSPPSFANVVDQAADNSAAQAPAPAAPAPAAPAPAPSPISSPPPAAPAPVATAPDQTADLSEDGAANSSAANAPASTGDWAVQLAAPASERAAHLEIARLERKFATQLSDHQLVSHSAQSNGRTVWRVRVAGLSRDDAASLCGRIKNGGGACFVARN